MIADPSDIALAAAFAVLTLFALLRNRVGVPVPVAIYVPYLWAFFLVFTLAELVAPTAGIWVLAVLSFLALREYFTLADLRIQDRWGMLAAYLAIPFMFWFIQIDWYGMFIVSIPVYAFLVVPFVVTLGREVEGTVLSIGLIDLGLFLLVYCIGHIGYLAFYATWMAVLLVLMVTACDLSSYVFRARDRRPLESAAYQLLAPAPVTVALALVLVPWTGIPWHHSVVLALLVPALVAMGCQTIDRIEADLGIRRDRLVPGRGQVLNSLKSFLYAAPVAFHYLRYVLEAF